MLTSENLSRTLHSIWFVRRLRSTRTRPIAVALALLATTGFFGWYLNRIHPIDRWLFPTYAEIWGYTLLFGLACFSSGWRVLSLLLAAPPRLLERIALALPLGVIVFYSSMFVCGALGLFNTGLFWGLPLLMIGGSAGRVLTDFQRIRRRMRPFHGRLVTPRRWPEAVGALFTGLCLVIIYAYIVYPNNLSYDAQWYHLPIAEQYVAAGAVVPFREGWFLGAYPHLSSFLYAWALLSPGALYEQTLLAGHLEFLLLVFTLVGVSALTSQLLRKQVPYAAALFFLFPGIFVYDSSLSTGADHILAFFTPFVILGLVRFNRNPTWREGVLAGALFAGAACTKYQASYLVPPAACAVLWIAVRHRKPAASLAWIASAALVSATHWLKNLFFYGDPFYPLLNRWFHAHPFHAEATRWVANYYWPTQGKPTGVGWEKWKNALLATVNFSLSPDGGFTWDNKALPLYGSLFTLLIPVTFLLKRPWRLLTQVLGVQSALLVWALTSHQERFLQTLTPWIAAVTAAILMRVWHSGRVARTCLVPMVGLQLVWGADLLALPRHAMTGKASLQSTLEYWASSYTPQRKTRNALPNTLEALGRRLQPKMRAILHNFRLRLGTHVEILTDETGWQGAIDYLQHQSPHDTLSTWKQVKATHVIWQPNRGGADSNDVARELVFLRAVHEYAKPTAPLRDWYVDPIRFVDESPLAKQPNVLGWYVCNTIPRPGIYEVRQFAKSSSMQTFPNNAVADAQAISAVAKTNAIALDSHCQGSERLREYIGSSFVRMGSAASIELWIRSRATP
jgi:hypothetical protein